MKIARHLSRIVITFFLISLPLTSRGNGCLRPSCQPVLKDGIYMGGGLGLDTYRVHQTVELLDFNGGLIDVSTSMTTQGAVGKIFVGYGQDFCWFYLGGEVFAKYTTAETSFSILEYHSNISIRTSVGGSLVPGVKITPSTMIYGRLGYDRTFFKIIENGTAFGDDNRREWANAVDIGIGIERAITPRFAFRIEYIFTNFGDFHTEFNTKISPKGNEVSLDFLYHFYSCF